MWNAVYICVLVCRLVGLQVELKEVYVREDKIILTARII